MVKFLKPIFKLLVPYLVTWLIKKAEKLFTKAKAGTDKKAYVIAEIEEFVKEAGFDGILDKEKLSKLIEDKVYELLNKIDLNSY